MDLNPYRSPESPSEPQQSTTQWDERSEVLVFALTFTAMVVGAAATLLGPAIFGQ
jgi:hypothetical protein